MPRLSRSRPLRAVASRWISVGLAAVMTALATPALCTPVQAETPGHRHGDDHRGHEKQGHGDRRAPYAGQQTRAIKSLSPADLAALRRGEGWGMAKAAELNGVPGPAHLLELKDRIPLSASQVTRIEALHADMRRQAVAAGKRLVALERALNDGFANGSMTDARLRELLGQIAEARRALRYVHLSAHLKTPAVLTAAQIARYNALRGYTGRTR